MCTSCGYNLNTKNLSCLRHIIPKKEKEQKHTVSLLVVNQNMGEILY